MNLWQTTPRDLNELSLGVALYFQFLRETALFFCGLTLLVAPQIACYFSGSVYASELSASTGLERLTLGNFGPLYGVNSTLQARRTVIIGSKCGNHTCPYAYMGPHALCRCTARLVRRGDPGSSLPHTELKETACPSPLWGSSAQRERGLIACFWLVRLARTRRAAPPAGRRAEPHVPARHQ